MKKRLFISIPTTKELRDVFFDLKEKYASQEIRWTVPENLHITVYFIGYVDEGLLPEIIEKLGSLFSAINPFNIVFDRISFAPPGKSPRMIWAVFNDDGLYKELTDKVFESVGGFSLQDNRGKDSIPHITLARFKNLRIAREASLTQPDIENKIIKVSSCDLMESKLLRSGPVYKVLHSFSFYEK